MRLHIFHVFTNDPLPRCRVNLRRFFSFFTLLLLFTFTKTIFAQHWIRPTAVCYLSDGYWLVADAGNGTLNRIDTTLRSQNLSFPGRLTEPVALAKDGLSIICFDRTQHILLKLNRRFETTSTVPLPDEYRNRFASVIAETSFGETVFIDRDRNELVAIDGFGRDSWHIMLPVMDPVISIASARDSLFVLFDSTKKEPRLLSLARYGSYSHWIAEPDSFHPALLTTAPGDSLFAISAKAMWNVRYKSEPVETPLLADPILSASSSESHLLLINQEGAHIYRWR